MKSTQNKPKINNKKQIFLFIREIFFIILFLGSQLNEISTPATKITQASERGKELSNLKSLIDRICIEE